MRSRLRDLGAAGLFAWAAWLHTACPAAPGDVAQAPAIARQPASVMRKLGGNARLTVEATGPALEYQWQFGGADVPGATASTLTLTNLSPASAGAYRVRVSNRAGTIVSEAATLTVVPPPVIVTQPASQQVPFGNPFTFSISASSPAGVTYEWYLNGRRYQAITSDSCSGLARENTLGTWTVVAIEQRFFQRTTSAPWTLAVALPGAAIAWGTGDAAFGAPPGNTNLAAVAAGASFGLGLTSEGNVVSWGTDAERAARVPAGLNDVEAIAAGSHHALALRYDGKVVAWGNTPPPPPDLTGVIAIAAGTNHSLALHRDGTVEAWGSDAPRVPAGLDHVIAIASGAMSLHALALKADGSVTAWGRNDRGQINVPPSLSGVAAIAAGSAHSLALKRDGTVVAWGDNRSGQCDVPAGLNQVMAIAAGFDHSLALKNNGSVAAWGANSRGQSGVPPGLGEITAIAANAGSLALLYSPTVEYPAWANADLLLLYNTTSADSVALKDYYLARRPMAAAANVLGVDCPAGDFISLADLQRKIMTPVSAWLAANPVKRPRYVVLLLGVPSRRSTPSIPVPGLPTGSVSYVLREAFPVRKPFITHIHMGGLTDCKAYVDKLKTFGDTYSPGRLLIRPSQGGYRNDRYYLDDVTGYPERPGTAARDALLARGVPATSITFSATRHLTTAADVAGFLNWGWNGGLGGNYANDGTIQFTGAAGWYLIQTIESFNGQRVTHQGNFVHWFARNAFGGADYSHTPVGAVTHTEEPSTGGVNDAGYFVQWALRRDLGICAWNSPHTTDFQVVGDPLVAR